MSSSVTSSAASRCVNSAVLSGKASAGRSWSLDSRSLMSWTIGQRPLSWRSLALPKTRVRKLGMGNGVLSSGVWGRSSLAPPWCREGQGGRQSVEPERRDVGDGARGHVDLLLLEAHLQDDL